MTLENILTIMEKFDSSDSAYLELKMGDVDLKLKKPEACAKQAVMPGQIVAGQMVPQAGLVQMPMMQEMTDQQTASNTSLLVAPEQTKEKAGMPQIQVDYIKAPLVGVFYAAASPDKAPFVKVGSKVEKGETVCLIEAMKMMSEVTAPRAGVIKEILVENGDLVEYDKPLFVIE